MITACGHGMARVREIYHDYGDYMTTAKFMVQRVLEPPPMACVVYGVRCRLHAGHTTCTVVPGCVVINIAESVCQSRFGRDGLHPHLFTLRVRRTKYVASRN